ncbi:MAG: hypothetical protein K9M45_10265 [Kiritimatiellales bacterium]|nr:hypothetical protein [Kiritimatiellales bacterium]
MPTENNEEFEYKGHTPDEPYVREEQGEYSVKEQLAAAGRSAMADAAPKMPVGGKLLPGAGPVRARPVSVVRSANMQNFLHQQDYGKIMRGLYARAWVIVICLLVLLGITLPVAIKIHGKTSYSAKSVLLYQRSSTKHVITPNSSFALRALDQSTAVSMILFPDNLVALDEYLGGGYSLMQLRDLIQISAERRAELIGIRIEGMPDEQTAINAANMFTEIVVRNSAEVYLKLARSAYDEYHRQCVDLQQQRKILDKEVEEFQLKHRVLALSAQHEVYLDSMSSTGQRLSVAKVTLSGLETRIGNYKDALAEMPDQIARAVQVENPIRLRIANTESALLEARTQYAADNPKIKRLEREIEEQRRMLAEGKDDQRQAQQLESNPAKDQIRNELLNMEAERQVAQQQVEQLSKELADLQDEFKDMPVVEQEYASLLQRKAELDALDTAYTASERSAELTLGSDLSDFQMVEPAGYAIISRSVWGKVLPILAVLFGFAGGLLLIVALELTDQKFRTRKQLELNYSVPCLATIVKIRGMNAENEYKSMLPFLREISDRLDVQLSGNMMKSLGVFSTTDGEGKSAVAFNLARYYAALGSNVIYVNFDALQPVALKDGDAAWSPLGLELYLKNEAAFEDIVFQHDNMDIIRLDDNGPENVELLRSPAMLRLWGMLEGKYDLIIAEAPPALDHALSGVIPAYLDHFIYVIASPISDKQYVDAGLRFLEERGYAPTALILNMADPYYLGDVRLQREYPSGHHSNRFGRNRKPKRARA